MTALRMPFSFTGELRPLPYRVVVTAVFFSQHLFIIALAAVLGKSFAPNEILFLVLPVRALAFGIQPPDATLAIAALYSVAVSWSLTALSLRRAANADVPGGFAVLSIVPLLQILIIVGLCVVSERRPAPDNDERAVPPQRDWTSAAKGVLAGMMLLASGVALATLGFQVYGIGIFVLTPFMVGVVTAFVSNRNASIYWSETVALVGMAMLLGTLIVLGVAIEGVICILMAAPLGFGVAVLGGALGRAIALRGKRAGRMTLSSIAMLPLVFAAESVADPTVRFETCQSIEVQAPPASVWRALVDMQTIEEAPGLPFRLGVAYPVRGHIEGEGVGATRFGEFSTGTAVERVTAWQPDRRLAFKVIEDIPGMHELSPYEHVHAVHVVGYFGTVETSFDLVPVGEGGTRIVERTMHFLKLEPAGYWLPMAQRIVNENNARVLRHTKRQAEERQNGDGRVAEVKTCLPASL